MWKEQQQTSCCHVFWTYLVPFSTDRFRIYDGADAQKELTPQIGLYGKYSKGKYEFSSGSIRDYVSTGEALTLYFIGAPSASFGGFRILLTAFKSKFFCWFVVLISTFSTAKKDLKSPVFHFWLRKLLGVVFASLQLKIGKWIVPLIILRKKDRTFQRVCSDPLDVPLQISLPRVSVKLVISSVGWTSTVSASRCCVMARRIADRRIWVTPLNVIRTIHTAMQMDVSV